MSNCLAILFPKVNNINCRPSCQVFYIREAGVCMVSREMSERKLATKCSATAYYEWCSSHGSQITKEYAVECKKKTSRI